MKMKYKKYAKEFLYLYNLEMKSGISNFIMLFIAMMMYRLPYFITLCKSKNTDYNNFLKINNSTVEKYLETFGSVSSSEFYRFNDNLIITPIILCIAFIALYSIYIWLKEWNGNNRTIYSLLTLPIPKLTVLLSKFATCISIFIVFYATQIFMLFIERWTFIAIVPKEIRASESLIEVILKTKEYGFLIISGTDVLLGGLAISAIVLVGFMVVLINRSFRWQGILGISAIGVILTFLLFAPIIFGFYAGEMLVYFIVFLIAVIIFGVFLCKYLLEEKVHV